MFFLAKGHCQVIIRDKIEERYEEWREKKLVVNDHFGEISLLYGCPRSATVEAGNYITCATINKARYTELSNIHTNLKDLLEKHIAKKYRDPLKLFLELKLNRLLYFKNLPLNVKNDFIFNMKIKTKEKGEYIYR